MRIESANVPDQSTVAGRGTAMYPQFALPVAPGGGASLARAFLWLGVAALVGSGVLAVILVLSRIPGVGEVFPLRDAFRAALVVHVDLSVLIWFMSFAGVLWSLASGARALTLGWAGWTLAAVGTLAMTVSPFFPDAKPLLNNYIPVLEQPVFLAGLAACGLGFGAAIVRVLAAGWRRQCCTGGACAARLGVMLGAAAGACAWGAMAVNLLQLPPGEGVPYFEPLFWGPGHVLQFQHALLAAVAWLWLASALGAPLRVGTRVLAGLFVLAALPLLSVPVLYALWPAGSPWYVAAFARLMEWGHLALMPLIVLALASLARVWRSAPSGPRSALLASLVLFCTGGVLAFMIRGVNVVVPAHYHGSIVGVTLAFMGLAYLLLPSLGFKAAGGAMARWQPWVYGAGQLLHILGLAWSGGYGVQRKVAGAEQALTTLAQKAGMGMMGLGGLIAVIGGAMFVIVCLRAMTSSSRASA